MLRKSGKWFMALGRAGKVGVVLATIVGASAVNAAANGAHKTANLNVTAIPASQAKTISQPKVTYQTVTTTEEIPFSTSQVNSNSLAKGTTRVSVAGVNGVRTHTFKVSYADGTETSRVEVSSEITTQPVTEVVTVGTYVAPQPSCPNGTYVNTAGNTVCSPYSSPSAPAGATAQCVDGTYSFSQSRSGTCSHHGGVSTWL